MSDDRSLRPLWLVLDAAVTQRVRDIVAYARKVAAGRARGNEVEARDELDLIADEFGRTVDDLRAVEMRLLQASERERRRVGADLHDDVCQRPAAAQLAGVLASVLQGENATPVRRWREPCQRKWPLLSGWCGI